MGNYISCAIVGPSVRNEARAAARVVLPSGEIQTYYEPTKAAELMFDMPNFFLVNSNSLQIGRRFSALSADEELEMGSVYAMFPMKRRNYVVSAADMGALFLVANSVAKNSGRISSEGGSAGGGKVVPELGGGGEVSTAAEGGEKNVAVDGGGGPEVGLESDEEAVGTSPGFLYRLSLRRSKKPLLETILEEPICSR